MDTSEIRYRVADFLKQHPPFNAVDDADLVALAAHGRVRFFPRGEFIAWQGEPHKTHVLVIQQGTVSLWDEHHGEAELRDVRGPGDWIGAEQFHGAPSCLYTARASADVVTYGFPALDLQVLLEKYPNAAAFVAAMGAVTTTLTRTDTASDPFTTYLQALAGPLRTISRQTTVAEAARQMLRTGAEALAIVGDDAELLGVVTSRVLLNWIAAGAGDPTTPVSKTRAFCPPIIGPTATVLDGAWAMISNGAATVTDDGTPSGRLLTVMTPRDLLPALGDQPAAIVDAIEHADSVQNLRALNHRARAFALKHLTSAAVVDWMLRYLAEVDSAIGERLLDVMNLPQSSGWWYTSGAWARDEVMAPRIPQLLWMRESAEGAAEALTAYERLIEAFGECGYLAGPETDHESAFFVATVDEWRERYVGWIRNPVLEGMQRNRALFDLRLVLRPGRSNTIESDVTAAVDRDILQILAHDCLADLPPLSFYENAVVEHSGEMTDVFRLERNALRPLVDLGRVFGMAARVSMGSSTLNRFAAARRLLPSHERIFREAAEALRIVLWQQARVGISQGTLGAELPASVLSRNDRHLLKGAFPVIQRLIEFTADPAWLDAFDVAVNRQL